MRGRAFWAVSFGASLLLASALAQAQCTKDIDCKGDRVCDAGKCKSPAPPVAASPGTPEGATPPASAEPASAPAPQAAPTVQAPAAATAPLGPDEPEVRRRSRTAMVSGIIMVSVGPLALLGALAAKNAQDNCDQTLDRDYPTHMLPTSEKYRVDDCNAYSVPFYAFSISGAVLIAAGIPLIIYGAKTVPAQPTAGSLRVLPWASPDSGGLKLRLEL